MVRKVLPKVLLDQVVVIHKLGATQHLHELCIMGDDDHLEILLAATLSVQYSTTWSTQTDRQTDRHIQTHTHTLGGPNYSPSTFS